VAGAARAAPNVAAMTDPAAADVAADVERLLTLREAAELCGVSLNTLRKRADRGQLRVVLSGGVRRVPRSELERAGLVPGADVRALRGDLERARRDLAEYRQLTARAESALAAEQRAHELTRGTLAEQRAGRQTVEQRLEALELDVARRPLRTWWQARRRREQPELAAA
jgi:excisionase family DNA binding protein